MVNEKCIDPLNEQNITTYTFYEEERLYERGKAIPHE